MKSKEQRVNKGNKRSNLGKGARYSSTELLIDNEFEKIEQSSLEFYKAIQVKARES
jgi:hypothetical protein